MSYQVLARKWRPGNFREMVGQEHVLQALINALDHDRLHHAYLFTGTRGVGKTTIARILAKCLNCESGVSSEPCGSCGSCQEIAEGRSIDLLEVDAASRTKVEDTRDLLENVQYAPTHSRFKVYLIDEVHMLSNHSFNALLKTLEEPPPHVKFLLATTDPQKLPATVLSRCLQFNLKNMPPEQIVGHLSRVLGEESIEFDEPALWLLGRAAAGSMRDALSLTDQAIAFGSGKVLEADVRNMLGSVDISFIYQLLEALAAGEPANVLSVVAAMSEHTADYVASLDDFLSLLHRVVTAQLVPEAIDQSWADAEHIKRLAASLTAEDAQFFYQMGLQGKRDLELVADPREGFEMVMLRMVAFRPAAVIDSSFGSQYPRLEESTVDVVPEGGVGGKKSAEPRSGPAAPTAVPGSETGSGSVAAHSAPQASTAAMPQGPAERNLAALSADTWPAVLDTLGVTGIVYNIASHCQLLSNSGGEVRLVLDQDNAGLFNAGHVDKIQQALEQFYDCPVSLVIEPGEPCGETPALRRQRLARERQQAAEMAIRDDPHVQSLLSRFDGELDFTSIAPIDN